MRMILAGALITLGLGDCSHSRASPVALAVKCPSLVLADTTRFFAQGDTVMAATKSDTVPRPHGACVTVYANAKDTVPRP